MPPMRGRKFCSGKLFKENDFLVFDGPDRKSNLGVGNICNVGLSRVDDLFTSGYIRNLVDSIHWSLDFFNDNIIMGLYLLFDSQKVLQNRKRGWNGIAGKKLSKKVFKRVGNVISSYHKIYLTLFIFSVFAIVVKSGHGTLSLEKPSLNSISFWKKGTCISGTPQSKNSQRFLLDKTDFV